MTTDSERIVRHWHEQHDRKGHLHHIPVDAKTRKTIPIMTGCIDYFPDAIAEVARLSYDATQQHHPGEPMHWDRSKSTDHVDCLLRHLVDRGGVDTDNHLHLTKVAWRALAMLQLALEARATCLAAGADETRRGSGQSGRSSS